MKLSRDDLAEILATIWETQLDLRLGDLSEAPPGSRETTEGPGPAMTGIVHLIGDFNGAVHLKCGRVAVRTAAARMFGQPEDTLDDADLRDALGELTNMAAGNIKVLLPCMERLSLPTVVDGDDYGIVQLESEVVIRLDTSSGGSPVTITVYRDRGSGDVSCD